MSTIPFSTTKGPESRGIWLIFVAAVVGLLISLVFYYTPNGSVAHSWGALLVVVSTALMLLAALSIALANMPRWLAVLLQALIFLDIIGTGVAAYFLETYILLALMVVALMGWIFRKTSDSPAAPLP